MHARTRCPSQTHPANATPPPQAVTRSLVEPSFRDFAAAIKTVQDAYTAAKQKGDTDGMKRALFQARRRGHVGSCTAAPVGEPNTSAGTSLLLC